MANRLHRSPSVVEYAATPGSPAWPGGYVWVRGARVVGVAAVDKQKLTSGEWVVTGGRKVGENDAYVLYENLRYGYRTYAPPRPAVPAQGRRTVVTGRAGWDGGARSKEVVERGGTFWFTFTRTAAVLVGLAPPGISYTYATPRHAWLRSGNRLDIVESGRTVYTFLENIPDESLEGWVFGVRRRLSGQVDYMFQPGAAAAQVVAYSSPTDRGDVLVGVAMPYTLGDSVEPRSIDVNRTSLDSTIPAVVGRVTDTQYAFVSSDVGGVVGSLVSNFTAKLNASLPAVTGKVGRWSSIGGRVAGVMGAVRGEPTFSTNDVFSVVGGVTAYVTGKVGAIGAVAAEIPPVLGRVEQVPHGRILADVGYPITGFLTDLVRDYTVGTITVGVRSELDVSVLMLAVENVWVGSTTTVTIIVDMASADGVRVADATSLGELITMVAREGLYVNDGRAAFARREALQYAINLATGAPSAYEGFDFRGFVTVRGVTYGWKADGLYKIGGRRQCDDTIRAFVDFGADDMGTTQAKFIPTAWLGLRADGQTYLRVQADDGHEVVYRAIPGHQTQKVRLGRGIGGRQWSMTLELVDVSFASLDVTEYEVAVSQRRFGSR